VKFRFIAVEGPIGVGKTSLVERLAPRCGAKSVFESLENPFLLDFYDEKEGAAFQAQLFFLLNRYRQQRDLSQGDLFQEKVITDYIFAKDRIFAYLNLTDDELAIYEKLYALLEADVPRPDLTIYLQAEDSVLMQRIQKRHRRYERDLAESYITEMNRAYNYFFYHYKSSPLLVIDTSRIDFVEREEDLEEILSQIEKMEKGIQFYSPLGAREGPRRPLRSLLPGRGEGRLFQRGGK
jgi:deoxyadenosine/deoxycytidine kinase